MNLLLENQYISEMECGANISYVLSDNRLFLSTEYKVLQSQVTGCFVRCMKLLWNGKVQLYYLTQGLKPFSSLLSSLDADSFLMIVGNLFSGILEVKNNGFLSCRNIELSFERIYVDPATYKVSLIYLPLSEKIYGDNAAFENEIRTGLVKLIAGMPAISSAKTVQFSSDLQNGALSMEELTDRMKGGGKRESRHTGKTTKTGKSGLLRMTAMNLPERIEIVVDKDEFVIGKKPAWCDGVISFNKMISRSHCKISKQGDQYVITDLQSANGTYVNRVRVQPNQSAVIRNGDVIRLADSDFQVTMD